MNQDSHAIVIWENPNAHKEARPVSINEMRKMDDTISKAYTLLNEMAEKVKAAVDCVGKLSSRTAQFRVAGDLLDDLSKGIDANEKTPILSNGATGEGHKVFSHDSRELYRVPLSSINGSGGGGDLREGERFSDIPNPNKPAVEFIATRNGEVVGSNIKAPEPTARIGADLFTRELFHQVARKRGYKRKSQVDAKRLASALGLKTFCVSSLGLNGGMPLRATLDKIQAVLDWPLLNRIDFDEIRRRIGEAGFSIAEFSRRANVSGNILYSCVKNDSVGHKTLIKFAGVLGCEVEDLMRHEPTV